MSSPRTSKKPKRKPKPRTLAPAKYTEQVVLLVSKDVRAVLDVASREHGISQAAAARAFLHAGMVAAGYEGLKTTDEPGNLDAIEHGTHER